MKSEIITLYDEFKCFKNFIFESDSEDDVDEGKKLTSLVRETYVKRIRQLLHNNYKVWSENYQNVALSGEGKRLTTAEIEKCIKFLEQKALRSCMLANLYQKAMSFMMTDIKKRTKEMKLYESLIRSEEWDTISYAEKFIQTEDCITMNQEVQTDPVCQKYTSLLDLPLPDCDSLLNSLDSSLKSNSNKIKMHSTPNVYPFKETVAKVSPRLRNPSLTAKKRRLSEVDSKNNKNSTLLGSDVHSDEKNSHTVNNNNNLLNNNKLHGSNVLVNGNNSVDSFILNGVPSNSTNSVFDLRNILLQNVEGGGSSNSSKNNDANDDVNQNNLEDDNLLTSLDQRLMEMGLLNNEESNNSSQVMDVSTSSLPLINTSRGHRGSWYVEAMAHACNFTRHFLPLHAKRKAKLYKKFNRLFGSSSSDEVVELSEENLAICRKRIANMVVAELTPYFEKKLITSRYLFKEFAKRVTNSVMDKNYAPNSLTVKQSINQYFNKNKCITDVIDLEL